MPNLRARISQYTIALQLLCSSCSCALKAYGKYFSVSQSRRSTKSNGLRNVRWSKIVYVSLYQLRVIRRLQQFLLDLIFKMFDFRGEEKCPFFLLDFSLKFLPLRDFLKIRSYSSLFKVACKNQLSNLFSVSNPPPLLPDSDEDQTSYCSLSDSTGDNKSLQPVHRVSIIVSSLGNDKAPPSSKRVGMDALDRNRALSADIPKSCC